MKERTALVIFIGVMSITLTAQTWYQINETSMLRDQVEEGMNSIVSAQLYNTENYAKLSAAGVYFAQKDYYCVKTRGRDWEDIRMTDYHEMCHAFVDMDYDHFCEHENQTNWQIEKHIK